MQTHLTLHIDLEADPIAGSLGRADGPGRRFTGWIGLVAALDAVRADQEPGPGAAAWVGSRDLRMDGPVRARRR